jgi:hypothetical protein
VQDLGTKNDIPLPLALCLLGCVLAFIFFGADFDRTQLMMDQMNKLLEANEWLLTCSGIMFFFSVFNLAVFFKHLLGHHRQGSKLKTLLNEGNDEARVKIKNATVSSLFSLMIFVFMDEVGGVGRLFLGYEEYATLNHFVKIVLNINLSVFIGVCIYLLRPMLDSFLKISQKSNGLGKFPEIQNEIVLGSSGEDEGLPEWETIGEKGLCGNVLVSGSIGSGKTQGTMLTYLEQLFQNFSPSPSVLAIDPKRTFVKKLESIACSAGLENKIIRVTLKNGTTFNPIYFENALKNGRFLTAAYMVRAAAVNSMGSDGDSSFWQQQAFNLIKNSIVYCAAIHGYYTLQNLYTAMLKASHVDEFENDGFASNLRQALESGEFDEEESNNVRMALEYFESEFAKLDHKVKSGVLATATSFLNQFQEHNAAKTFCPEKKDLTFPSMDKIVDDGMILLLDIENKVLAKSMGTFFKLHYQQSVLERIANKDRSKDRLAVIAIDEYPDVVTVGDNTVEGDDTFLAKAREGRAVSIAATQSLSSLEDKIGKSATDVLIQSFRTTIICHSSDLKTIKWIKELFGRDEQKRKSHTVSEQSQKASKNYIEGGLKHERANVSESVSESEALEYAVTGKELSRLKTFEAFAQIFDGTATNFKRVYLKPYFLRGKMKNWAHSKVLKALSVAGLAFCMVPQAEALPNVCTVINTPEFSSCMSYSQSGCTCGWPPHPCASFSYYIPVTFAESMPDKKSSFFSAMPGAAAQLNKVSKSLPFGTEGDIDTQSFQSRTIAVPFSSYVLSNLACDGTRQENTCFGSMSEDVDWHWRTGKGDLAQPKFLAWQAAPKACLLKGAVEGLSGGENKSSGGSGSSCSYPLPKGMMFPPSSRSVCNGWGIFFPRYGSYNGPSQTVGALMSAARIRSLGTEVFQSVPTDSDEKFQMIYPQSSSCFREGENVAFLETVRRVREERRLVNGKLKGHLFVIWKRVSCCKEFSEVASTLATIAALKAVCAGLGGS